MAKKTVTFEVDDNDLFDMLHKMKGDFSGIGQRVVGAMLTGSAPISEMVGMAVYGIVFKSSDPIPKSD